MKKRNLIFIAIFLCAVAALLSLAVLRDKTPEEAGSAAVQTAEAMDAQSDEKEQDSASAAEDEEEEADASSEESNALQIEQAVQALEAQCREELTACRDTLSQQLETLLQGLQSTWRSYPAEERTQEKKDEYILMAMEQVFDLEDEADALVDEIITQYKARVKAAGGSTSRITALEETYQAEKESLRAYYLNLYLN